MFGKAVSRHPSHTSGNHLCQMLEVQNHKTIHTRMPRKIHLGTRTQENMGPCHLQSWKVTKAEADRKFENLVREGIEPHPEPTHKNSTQLLVTSINVQGVPGVWRAISTFTDCILLLQDTPFQKEELRVFINTAKRRRWKVYHAAASKTSGRPKWWSYTSHPCSPSTASLDHFFGKFTNHHDSGCSCHQ